MKKPRVLFVDDNKCFLELFLRLAEVAEYEIVPVNSPLQALEVLEKNPVDLIISDVHMPDMTGQELFAKVQDYFPEIPFILITAFGSTQDGIQAVRSGAFHYFEKPLDDKLELFWTTVREAVAKREMIKELNSLRGERHLKFKTIASIIGQSDAIKQVIQSIEGVAGLPVTVLISGETGTGKELAAQAIHMLSKRREKPFIPINCSEFSAGVLESEIFGHERGSFTGALQQKLGIFEIAHQGTLFFDEISEAPMPFQAKLLRVLETKTFTRVGGISSIYSDFRIIAATNRNLEADLQKNLFRRDLFYRLNVYPIKIPPLRDRVEDIPLLADFYLKKFSQTYHKKIEGFSMNALLCLRAHSWPGNIRELVNVIERAVITCQDNVITTKHLPFQANNYESLSDLNLIGVEKFFIDLALQRAESNRTKAAELLGISRKTLLDKLRTHGLNGHEEI